MLKDTFQEVVTYLKTCLPSLFADSTMAQPKFYKNYAIATFDITQHKMNMEDLMDMLEDQANMSFLYHHIRSDEMNSSQRFCAYPSPQEYMYKINAQTNIKGYVDRIALTVFCSVEVMILCIIDENKLLKKDFGYNKIAKGFENFITEYT